MIKLFLKLLFSVACILIIIYWFPVEKIGEILRNVNKNYLFLAFGLNLASICVYARGLSVAYTRIGGSSVTYLKTLKQFFYSIFFSFWLPSAISRDAGMIYFGKSNTNLRGSFKAVLMNRIVGMMARFSFLILMSCVLFHDLIRHLLVFVLVGFGVMLGLIALVFYAPQILPKRLRSWFESVRQLLYEMWIEFKAHRGVVVRIYMLMLCFVFFDILVVYCLGQALGAQVAFVYYLALDPLIKFATLVPISFAGIGLQDLSFVGIFPFFSSMATAEALGISLILHFFKLIFMCTGCLLFNLENLQQKAQARA